MFFTLLSDKASIPHTARSQVFLINDFWDDYFQFATFYGLWLVDQLGAHHNIGGVKIAEFGMGSGHKSGFDDHPKAIRRARLPVEFQSLGDNYFSLGQDDSYYEDLNDYPDLKDKVLIGLRDVAYDLELFEKVLDEPVTGISLLRSVTPATVRGQLNRLAHGGARLTTYEFSYTAPKPKLAPTPVSLDFTVTPKSQPPTNVHVLIGRNGVGKTRLLDCMTRALVEPNAHRDEVGYFDHQDFANIVSVTFSAFDPFEPLPVRQNKSTGVQYFYIGLKHISKDEDGKPLPPKNPAVLSRDFSLSVRICRQGARADRWLRALQMLEADPIFKDAEIADLAKEEDENVLKERAISVFRRLSSGHKIVLLTTTRLVETVEERTLVLIDEPEAHLHPPLLSAFVRALSELLINRNGVAVIATHSPVILQEVPKKCVWKIRRTGDIVKAERPDIETFGENVGILTHEVFGLEVTQSGFHKLIQQTIEQEPNYKKILESFNNELGAEARAIARALLAAHSSEDDIE